MMMMMMIMIMMMVANVIVVALGVGVGGRADNNRKKFATLNKKQLQQRKYIIKQN